jgi:flagellar biosynthesis protein FlhA
MTVDPLCVEVGYDLIAAVGADKPGGILDKIKGLRRQLASELGFVLPPVRVRDNLQLAADQYQVLLRGVKIGGARMPRGKLLALEAGVTRAIEGEKTSDPAFGLPALWISPDRADEARAGGYTVVDPPSVISTHLMELIGRHSAELLGREDTARLIDALQKQQPKAVAELVPERLTIGEVQRVLQGLLRERVPVRDLQLIVEALADAAQTTRDPALLIEAVRRALGRVLTAPLIDERGILKAVALDAPVEEELQRGLVPDAPNGGGDGISPARARELVTRIGSTIGASGCAALVVGPRLRPALGMLLRTHLPHTQVLSTLEIPPDVTLRAMATVA